MPNISHGRSAHLLASKLSEEALDLVSKLLGVGLASHLVSCLLCIGGGLVGGLAGISGSLVSGLLGAFDGCIESQYSILTTCNPESFGNSVGSCLEHSFTINCTESDSEEGGEGGTLLTAVDCVRGSLRGSLSLRHLCNSTSCWATVQTVMLQSESSVTYEPGKSQRAEYCLYSAQAKWHAPSRASLFHTFLHSMR